MIPAFCLRPDTRPGHCLDVFIFDIEVGGLALGHLPLLFLQG